MCVRMQMNIYTCSCQYMCTYRATHTYIYICTGASIYWYMWLLHTHQYAHVYTSVCICMPIHTSLCSYAYVCACGYTHMYIHMCLTCYKHTDVQTCACVERDAYAQWHTNRYTGSCATHTQTVRAIHVQAYVRTQTLTHIQTEGTCKALRCK